VALFYERLPNLNYGNTTDSPSSNFIEFLTLYGHFAGEELEEDDEDLEPDEYFGAGDLYE